MTSSHKCQMTMSGKPPFRDSYFQCGKPAKAWIKDQFKRTGWKGRQYLCGVHACAHDKIATRFNKPLANRL